jgi:class 3 adenylate cyclase/tetratricopeptide (TPR) repeat protein
MKCLNCDTDNLETRKYCLQCGARLSLLCPDCHFENQPGDRFCGGCGKNFIPSSTPPGVILALEQKLKNIQRYLPEGLADKILSQRHKIEGEHRLVTVMFCDMAGFTPLVEKLGSEKAYRLMDQVYEILIHKVDEYEGAVNEMTGDGVMALFGAPMALEDAPQKAIRSALAIHREMAMFSDRLQQEGDSPRVRLRIGIHTGPVVVGSLGNNLRVEFKAVGDTVNLASRVEAMAEPSTTYITEDTFKLTEGLFRFEALGDRRVKGLTKPVKVYRVIAPSARRTRFDVSAEKGLTPFTARERELELLLDGFQRVKGGRGQAYSIMSDPGAGKSRLVYEFRKAVAGEDVTFIEGRCLSYSRNVAYHPILEVLRSAFDVTEEDEDQQIREKARNGFRALGISEEGALPYLLELLSPKESEMNLLTASNQEKTKRIIEALNTIIIRSSQSRPLILVIEDLHWADKSSTECLTALMDSIPGQMIFLILTYRPEFVHSWTGRSYHSQITLNRLSSRNCLKIANHILSGAELGKNLEDLIIEKTDGIPFFIEEFIRSLKDLKAIELKKGEWLLAKTPGEASIPSKIHDVIMARVDLLSEAAKEILRTGSVIEREFSFDLISRVTELSEQELRAHLSHLKNAELLYERGVYPKSTYVFKHALTREVIYDSLLTSRRKALHESIGNAIEGLYQDSIAEHYVILADHFMESDNHFKASEYARLAGKRAESSAALNDAIAYTRKRVACLEKLPRNEEVEKLLVDARTGLGIYLFLMSHVAEAKEAIDPVVDFALKGGDRRRISQIYMILGYYSFTVKEDFPGAFKHLEQAVRVAEEADDVATSVLANYMLGLALSWNCEFEKTSLYIERALSVVVAINIPWSIAIMKSYLSFYAYNYQGRNDLGFRTSLEAVEIAEESGDIYSKAMAYTTHGFSCFYRGSIEEATSFLLAGLRFSETINLLSFCVVAHQWLGYSYFEMGDYENSQAHFEKAIQLREIAGTFPSTDRLSRIALARTKAYKNNKADDLELLCTHARDNKVKLYEGSMARWISEILIKLDDDRLNEAEEWISRALGAHGNYGMMWDLGMDHLLHAQILTRKGLTTKAEESLRQCKEIFKACGASSWVQRIEARSLAS